MTSRRRQVLEILMAAADHPTASELFVRAREACAGVSMATVYNCLEALARNGLVRQVHIARDATRFCANPVDHAHFYCEACGRVFDVEYEKARPGPAVVLPAGFHATHRELSVRGRCAACGRKGRAKARAAWGRAKRKGL
ncbi:MAG TPA: transcriptional repressor [Candidatus Paceibacterota bacterium]|nr:transcriptional repressor [Verrucomicrobiota bacterium]HRZ46585.1 transcriptional repressor [Candidatus Paceibacterota bacterium]HRZ92440.1 transcriptional repressor [Candidatus Paceibacterota bacterium]